MYNGTACNNRFIIVRYGDGKNRIVTERDGQAFFRQEGNFRNQFPVCFRLFHRDQGRIREFDRYNFADVRLDTELCEKLGEQYMSFA